MGGDLTPWKTILSLKWRFPDYGEGEVFTKNQRRVPGEFKLGRPSDYEGYLGNRFKTIPMRHRFADFGHN